MTTTLRLWCTTYRLWSLRNWQEPNARVLERCYTANCFAVQQTPLLHSKLLLLSSKRRCCTANSFAVQQTPLLHSKFVCCLANAAAALQIRLLSGNSRCCVANSFAAQQLAVAAQQIHLLSGKRRCCIANSLAVQQLTLQHCKSVCCAGIPAAARQIKFPCSNGVFSCEGVANPLLCRAI